MDWPPHVPKGFPLTVHRRGYVKKGLGWICGKLPPDDALRVYHAKAAAALEKPKPVKVAVGDEQTVSDLAARYLAVRQGDTIRRHTLARIDAALIAFAAHECGRDAGPFAGDVVGDVRIADLKPDHFASFLGAARIVGDGSARDKCRFVAGLFNFAAEEDWIDRPVKFGRRFSRFTWGRGDPVKGKPPTVADALAVLAWCDDRLARQAAAPAKRRKNVVGPAPLRQFKAMVLLALNGGYGSSELAQLPRAVLDLDAGLIDYRRGKTKQQHVVPLWPETSAALRVVVEDADRLRPDDRLLFRTREGRPWAFECQNDGTDGGPATVTSVDNCAQWFNKAARACGIKIVGQSFYSLKDLHCTLGDESGDIAASYALTGHSAHSRGRDPYVTVSLDRVRKVVDSIRHRFWPPVAPAEPAGETTPLPQKASPASSAARAGRRSDSRSTRRGPVPPP